MCTRRHVKHERRVAFAKKAERRAVRCVRIALFLAAGRPEPPTTRSPFPNPRPGSAGGVFQQGLLVRRALAGALEDKHRVATLLRSAQQHRRQPCIPVVQGGTVGAEETQTIREESTLSRACVPFNTSSTSTSREGLLSMEVHSNFKLSTALRFCSHSTVLWSKGGTFRSTYFTTSTQARHDTSTPFLPPPLTSCNDGTLFSLAAHSGTRVRGAGWLGDQRRSGSGGQAVRNRGRAGRPGIDEQGPAV